MINYWIMIIISYSSASVWIKLSSKYVTLSFFCMNVSMTLFKLETQRRQKLDSVLVCVYF